MPLTAKGHEIENAMIKNYGEEKGKEVFYASKNKGTISGVDEQSNVMQFSTSESPVESMGGAPSAAEQQELSENEMADVAEPGQEQSGVGAESWVHGRKNSTGYEIKTGDMIHPSFQGDRSLYGMRGLDSVPEWSSPKK